MKSSMRKILTHRDDYNCELLAAGRHPEKPGQVLTIKKQL